MTTRLSINLHLNMQPNIIYKTSNLYDFFNETIKLSKHNKHIKIYIVNLFSDIAIQEISTQKSITLLYQEALEKYSFNDFRIIADWLFFSRCIFPESLKGTSIEYYDSIAQNSYYKCYLLSKWVPFENLADEFNNLTQNVKKDLINSFEHSWSLNSFKKFILN